MEYKDLSPAVQSEEQLRQLIQEKVAAGETSFPSERALENELGVSRTTLRRSLDTLEKEAVIQKKKPKRNRNQSKANNQYFANEFHEQPIAGRTKSRSNVTRNSSWQRRGEPLFKLK